MTAKATALLGDTPAGAEVFLDVHRLVTSRMLLQANSGGGKSWALRRILEQTHGHVQHLVLDVEGEFHTLRERCDYVLAAKTGGDTVADVRSAPLLARRLLELGVSAILDLYELKAHDRIRFVRLFLEALIDAPKALWHPALVVIDEAHVFCPQTGEAESAGAVKDLMTRGRKRGFCGLLATQRLSKLHKDAAAEANCKLIGRATLDVDMKRAADELGFSSKEDQARLRTLPVGTFFAFGPGLSDQVVQVQIGQVRTTHPRAGEAQAPVPPPREKVKKVLDQLKDLPKEAEEETKTLAQAKAKIVELERQVRAKPAPAAAPVPKRVEVPVLKDSQVARLEVIANRLVDASVKVQEQASAVRKAIAAVHVPPHQNGTWRTNRVNPAPVPHVPAAIVARSKSVGRSEPSGDLPKGEAAVLNAIAQHAAGVSREQLSVLTAYKRSSRDTYLQKLQARGSIEVRGDTITATEAGAAALGDQFRPLPTGEALRQYWIRKLPIGESAVFQAVVVCWPNAITVESIDEATGYKRSSRDTYLQKLNARKLIERVGRGAVKASDLLFTPVEVR